MLPVEKEVLTLLQDRYLMTNLSSDLEKWKKETVLNVYQRLLSVYDAVYDPPDEGRATSQHIQSCLRLLGISHLATKKEELFSRQRIVRIISAIDGRIHGRHSSQNIAKRNRVVIKQEEMREKKQKKAEKRVLCDNTVNQENFDPFLPGTKTSDVTTHLSHTTNEEHLLNQDKGIEHESTDGIFFHIPVGRQLARTPLKPSDSANKVRSPLVVITENSLALDKTGGSNLSNVSSACTPKQGQQIPRSPIQQLNISCPAKPVLQENSVQEIATNNIQRSSKKVAAEEGVVISPFVTENYIPSGRQLLRTPEAAVNISSKSDIKVHNVNSQRESSELRDVVKPNSFGNVSVSSAKEVNSESLVVEKEKTVVSEGTSQISCTQGHTRVKLVKCNGNESDNSPAHGDIHCNISDKGHDNLALTAGRDLVISPPVDFRNEAIVSQDSVSAGNAKMFSSTPDTQEKCAFECTQQVNENRNVVDTATPSEGWRVNSYQNMVGEIADRESYNTPSPSEFSNKRPKSVVSPSRRGTYTIPCSPSRRETYTVPKTEDATRRETFVCENKETNRRETFVLPESQEIDRRGTFAICENKAINRDIVHAPYMNCENKDTNRRETYVCENKDPIRRETFVCENKDLIRRETYVCENKETDRREIFTKSHIQETDRRGTFTVCENKAVNRDIVGALPPTHLSQEVMVFHEPSPEMSRLLCRESIPNMSYFDDLPFTQDLSDSQEKSNNATCEIKCDDSIASKYSPYNYCSDISSSDSKLMTQNSTSTPSEGVAGRRTITQNDEKPIAMFNTPDLGKKSVQPSEVPRNMIPVGRQISRTPTDSDSQTDRKENGAFLVNYSTSDSSNASTCEYTKIDSDLDYSVHIFVKEKKSDSVPLSQSKIEAGNAEIVTPITRKAQVETKVLHADNVRNADVKYSHNIEQKKLFNNPDSISTQDTGKPLIELFDDNSSSKYKIEGDSKVTPALLLKENESLAIDDSLEIFPIRHKTVTERMDEQSVMASKEEFKPEKEMKEKVSKEGNYEIDNQTEIDSHSLLKQKHKTNSTNDNQSQTKQEAEKQQKLSEDVVCQTLKPRRLLAVMEEGKKKDQKKRMNKRCNAVKTNTKVGKELREEEPLSEEKTNVEPGFSRLEHNTDCAATKLSSPIEEGCKITVGDMSNFEEAVKCPENLPISLTCTTAEDFQDLDESDDIFFHPSKIETSDNAKSLHTTNNSSSEEVKSQKPHKIDELKEQMVETVVDRKNKSEKPKRDRHATTKETNAEVKLSPYAVESTVNIKSESVKIITKEKLPTKETITCEHQIATELSTDSMTEKLKLQSNGIPRRKTRISKKVNFCNDSEEISVADKTTATENAKSDITHTDLAPVANTRPRRGARTKNITQNAKPNNADVSDINGAPVTQSSTVQLTSTRPRRQARTKNTTQNANTTHKEVDVADTNLSETTKPTNTRKTRNRVLNDIDETEKADLSEDSKETNQPIEKQTKKTTSMVSKRKVAQNNTDVNAENNIDTDDDIANVASEESSSTTTLLTQAGKRGSKATKKTVLFTLDNETSCNANKSTRRGVRNIVHKNQNEEIGLNNVVKTVDCDEFEKEDSVEVKHDQFKNGKKATSKRETNTNKKAKRNVSKNDSAIESEVHPPKINQRRVATRNVNNSKSNDMPSQSSQPKDNQETSQAKSKGKKTASDKKGTTDMNTGKKKTKQEKKKAVAEIKVVKADEEGASGRPRRKCKVQAAEAIAKALNDSES